MGNACISCSSKQSQQSKSTVSVPDITPTPKVTQGNQTDQTPQNEEYAQTEDADFLKPVLKKDRESQTHTVSTQNATSQTDFHIENDDEKTSHLPADYETINDVINEIVEIVNESVNNESSFHISENKDSEKSPGPIQPNAQENQERLDRIVDQYDIQKDLSNLGLDDSALDTSNIFEHFSPLILSDSDSPVKDDLFEITGTDGGYSQEPKELKNESDDHLNYPEINELLSLNKIQVNNEEIAEIKKEDKLDEIKQEDSFSELDETVEFKRLDKFIKRKVSLIVDKSDHLDDEYNTEDDKVKEPIDSNLAVSKIVQAYNIYKVSVKKALEKQQSKDLKEDKILKSDGSIDRQEVPEANEKSTFKSFFGDYIKFDKLECNLTDVEPIALNSAFRSSTLNEIGFLNQSMNESFTCEYLFHYTSLENINSISVDGCINTYKFLAYGEGIFFHRIQPQNHDDLIIDTIYADLVKHMSANEKEHLKTKIKCAIAFKNNNKLLAFRISNNIDLFKRNKSLSLNDFDPLFIIIRKSNKK